MRWWFLLVHQCESWAAKHVWTLFVLYFSSIEISRQSLFSGWESLNSTLKITCKSIFSKIHKQNKKSSGNFLVKRQTIVRLEGRHLVQLAVRRQTIVRLTMVDYCCVQTRRQEDCLEQAVGYVTTRTRKDVDQSVGKHSFCVIFQAEKGHKIFRSGR